MKWLVVTVTVIAATPAFSHVQHTFDFWAPRGYTHFCKRLPHECLPSKGSVETRGNMVVSSQERRNELVETNRAINNMIQPMTDKQQYKVDEYWTIGAKKGDCEEYVLEKRKRLIELGWPSSSLLIATGIASNGEGHAVLLVVMTDGVFVLDNLTSKIHNVHTTKVKLATAQKPEDPRKWAIVRVNENIHTIPTR